MNDHGPYDTFPSLNGIMRVIPASAVVRRDPFVRKAITRSDRALSDCRYAIIFGIVELTNAVKVNASAVVLQLVVDGYNHRVAPIGLNDRTWQLPIDCKSDALDTIGSNCRIGNIEIIVNSPTGFRSELVVVGCDIRSAVWWRAALIFARYAVLIKCFAPEDSGCLF